VEGGDEGENGKVGSHQPEARWDPQSPSGVRGEGMHPGGRVDSSHCCSGKCRLAQCS
jgi:hypothetical protein